MPKKNLKLDGNVDLEGNIDVSDLSSLSLDDKDLNDIDEALNMEIITEVPESTPSDTDTNSLDVETSDQVSKSIDESVFLDAGEGSKPIKNVLKDGDNFGSYLRWFFFSAILTLFGVLTIALFYSFSVYIREASKTIPDSNYQSYVQTYKQWYGKVKSLLGKSNTYVAPVIGSDDESQKVNEIINATDIDYIEKKDLLSQYTSDLVRRVEDRATYAENLKQDIAKQGFLPEELETLLSEDQAIDTIQRSLNALEVIKFSTATRVFLYMNTALSTISEMIRDSDAGVENLHGLFEQLNSRGERDISSYVYMCYLNPFEKDADCNEIGDLDLYYNIANDNSINIKLFKNAMSAISQLLEREDTSLFSITFNGFNASDKNIQFNIEVFTNQEDEKNLIQQGKKNPNIFILTNIINLLKQSSFIIGAEISTKEVTVDTRMLEQGGISRPVKYSTMDFTVPIQKNTEREIFDYIDLDSMGRLLIDRGFIQENQNVQDDVKRDSDLELQEESLESEEQSEITEYGGESSLIEDESEEASVEEGENGEQVESENLDFSNYDEE